MKLLCRDKDKAFAALQALKDRGQKAYLVKTTGEDPAIRIKTPLIGGWDFFDKTEEITSADQLTEKEYRIIA